MMDDKRNENRGSERRVRAVVGGATLLAAIVAIGCGGSGTSTDAPVLDAVAFKQCIFASNIKRGSYEKVTSPSDIVTGAADQTAGTVFEGGAGGDGLAFFFTYDSADKAASAKDTVDSAMSDLEAKLAPQAPKGMTLGKPSSEIKDSIVIGVLPFSSDAAPKLSDQTLADAASCIKEVS